MACRALDFDLESTDEEHAESAALRSVDDRRRAGRGKSLVAAGLVAAGLAGAAALVARGPAGAAPQQQGAPGRDVLGLAARHVADAHARHRQRGQASAGKDNCNVTQSCADPGMQCYQQDGLYAQCRGSCVSGPDPTHWDGKPWTCKELGARAAGEDQCVEEGSDCSQSKCCRQPGHTCFEKTPFWALCKASCTPGPSFADVDGKPWSCKKLGSTKESTAEWVAGQCAAGAGANCIDVGCCKNAGEQCYKKDDYYGECKPSCSEGWSCATVGMRTPAKPQKQEILKMPDWGWDQCSHLDEGCKDSGCCIGMDVQCYEKDEHWAQCKTACAPGPHADDHNATWSCNTYGPRSYGTSKKGFPSLYCFAVMRTVGYEVGLMTAQFNKGVGIFGCDDYNLFTADGTVTIGTAKSIWFAGAPVTVSVDNTAGNTELFVHAWDALIDAGIWRQHTFTLKADPDAVLLPDRVRTHLEPHAGQKVFIINCPWGDMIFGALEVYSYHALLEWATRGQDCPAPKNWGEDKYMTHCMDFLGVSRVRDFPILADNLCLGNKNCQDGVAAAYHPFKDVGAWFQCLDRATQAAPAAAPAAQQMVFKK